MTVKLSDETISDSELLKSVALGDIKAAEELVGRYEVKVYTMAMHLTSDEEEASKVTEQVFVKLISNIVEGRAEEFETMLHRVTYEFAIASLIGRVEQHNRDVRALCENIVGAELVENHYEDNEDPLQMARWRLMDSSDTLDATDDVLEIIEGE